MFSRSPIDEKLFLGNPILDPIEAHVDGLGVLHLHGVQQETNSGFIVYLHWGGGLGMAQLLQGNSEGETTTWMGALKGCETSGSWPLAGRSLR